MSSGQKNPVLQPEFQKKENATLEQRIEILDGIMQMAKIRQKLQSILI